MKIKKHFQDGGLKSIAYSNDRYHYYFKLDQGYIKPSNGLKLKFEDFHFGLDLDTIHLNNDIIIGKNHYNWQELKTFFKIVKYLQGKTGYYDEEVIKENKTTKHDTIKTVKIKQAEV